MILRLYSAGWKRCGAGRDWSERPRLRLGVSPSLSYWTPQSCSWGYGILGKNYGISMRRCG
jgi:hypothetical protein